MKGTTLNRLDLVQKLILVAIPLGLLHHADHVGRADHSAWPFRPEIGPFTFTLLIYPVLVLALLARERSWVRVLALGVVSLFTLVAHTLVEPPQQIYGTWANNLSTPPRSTALIRSTCTICSTSSRRYWASLRPSSPSG